MVKVKTLFVSIYMTGEKLSGLDKNLVGGANTFFGVCQNFPCFCKNLIFYKKLRLIPEGVVGGVA